VNNERETGSTFGLKRGVILPKKGLQELRKLLGEAAESGEEKPEAKLGFVENSAIFRRPGVTLVMRLIEGLFPDYKQVSPRPTGRATPERVEDARSSALAPRMRGTRRRARRLEASCQHRLAV
jgi:DNA polymerase III sliding clamp (beta) subunit (PCNA family)